MAASPRGVCCKSRSRNRGTLCGPGLLVCKAGPSQAASGHSDPILEMGILKPGDAGGHSATGLWAVPGGRASVAGTLVGQVWVGTPWVIAPLPGGISQNSRTHRGLERVTPVSRRAVGGVPTRLHTWSASRELCVLHGPRVCTGSLAGSPTPRPALLLRGLPPGGHLWAHLLTRACNSYLLGPVPGME